MTLTAVQPFSVSRQPQGLRYSLGLTQRAYFRWEILYVEEKKKNYDPVIKPSPKGSKADTFHRTWKNLPQKH